MSESEYSAFTRVLFGLSSPSSALSDLSSNPELGNIDWIDPTLNDSQKDAIRFALASREIALIHGPPGVFDSSPASCPPHTCTVSACLSCHGADRSRRLARPTPSSS